MGIIGIDLAQTFNSLLERLEPEDSLSVRQNVVRACVLDNGRPSGREITDRAITDPCALQANARRLHATEFALGSLYVGAIFFWSRAHAVGFANGPAPLLKALLLSFVFS